MKRTLIAIAILAVLGGVTNPSPERHKDEVKVKLNQLIHDKLRDEVKTEESESQWGNAGKAIGTAITNALVNGVVEGVVTTDNYLVFSLTRAHWDGEDHLIGVGAFGNVFLTKEIDRAFEEGIILDKEL